MTSSKRLYKVSMEHNRGHNESTLDGEKLAEWLRDIANNTESDFLKHLEVDLVE